ncbi:MAG TPA: DUF6252 family protein [Flavobacterium sp.]|uniref:DUF6252 family protein n=1 Tax=Flavobacterium sp. TaxID=239 RepID=UPI002C1D4353|nr:DUF6252 family protein [Flavobacterium sp.]HNP32914.1 DUF6252 family protein [Flavobacterium sp.]
MKNIKFLAGIFLILIAFTSCEIEPIDGAINPDDFHDPSSDPVVFKADFNGETWTGTTAQALISGNFISIGATKADGSTFSFLVEGTAAGTYPANTNILAYTPAGSEYGYWSINPNNETENTGSITITNIDTVNHRISGTFEYKGYWSDDTATGVLPVQFTNGVFTNLPYITQAETGNSFYAKVGGVEFEDVDLAAVTTDISGQSYISIGAQNASTDSMTVSVKSSLGTGTYNITGNIATDQVQAIYNLSDTDYHAVSGSITITSKTGSHIKGTFHFVTDGTTPFTVTEGAFDIDY